MVNMNQLRDMWNYAKPLLESQMEINLDYSVKSMVELEKILHVIKHTPNNHSYSVLIFGFYLGETIINEYEDAKWCENKEHPDVAHEYQVILKRGSLGVGVDPFTLMSMLFNGDKLPPIEYMFSSLDETINEVGQEPKRKNKKSVKVISTGEPSVLGTYRKIALIVSGNPFSDAVRYFDERISNSILGENEVVQEDEKQIMFMISKKIYDERVRSSQFQ